MPLPEEILDGKVKTVANVEDSGQYALTTGMCYELKEAADRFAKHNQMDKFHGMAENFLGFLMDNFNTEMVIYGARLALKNYGLPFDHKKLKNFGKFFERFGKLIIDA